MKNLIRVFITCFCLVGFAQNNDRKFLTHKQSGNKVEVSTDEGSYTFLFYNPEIVETSFLPSGETLDKDSHAVVLKPEATAVKLSETPEILTLTTSGITVKVQKAPFQISYLYKNKMLLSEKKGYSKTDSGYSIDFNLDSNEALMGGGARVLGMNRRGNRLQLYNRAQYGYETRAELMNFTMPLVMSSKIYAVHFDNPTTGWLDLDSKKDRSLSYESTSGRKTYQVVAGDSWEKLIENYTALTGRQPIPPRWAFGNFSSRFGYHSQAEAERTIKKFRDEKIPVDAIILDLYWFGKDIKGTMGNLEIFRDSFPDFEGMVNRFKADNVKTIPVTEPFILTTSNRWQEAVGKNILATDSSGKPFTFDFYFGNTGLIDIFKPEGKDWFWNIYKGLASKGVAGVWGDLGEPEVHPADLKHATGTADEVHNIYGHNWAKLVFEGYKKDFPTQRPFILMRSGYSGSQRFGMIPWSGDVNRTWGGLSGQPEIALQMGMQGMAYMHSDLGGFAGSNPDNELYARWLQYGVFQPIFRPHAQEEMPSEPVFRDEKTKALAKKSIALRYKLLPYNYTLAFQNNRTGVPLMRPLFFAEPKNKSLYGNSNEYLWGNDFLVSPVKEADVKGKEVYFPKTGNWFDLGVHKYKGGDQYRVPVKEDYVPYYVRGGAFITMTGTDIQSTEEYDSANLAVQYIHDSDVKESEGMFYDDDGKTPNAYENGNYEILRYYSKIKGRKIKITIKSEKGNNFVAKERKILFMVYDMNKMAKYPTTIKSGETKSITLYIKS